jgi:hypothetical protein
VVKTYRNKISGGVDDMRKFIALTFVLAIGLMFLAGCAAPQYQEAAPVPKETVKKTTTKPTTTKTVTQPTVTEPKEEPAPVQTMNKKVAELLQKHVGRVTSSKYMYQDQTNKPEEWETWVKGNKMRVKLREMDNVKGEVYVDNIYLDLSTRKAVGYCEKKVYRCADPNTPVDVKFSKYYRKTPFEWIAEVTYAEKEGEEQMQMRNMWKLTYTDDGKGVAMWVDDYYGLPSKVRVVDGSAVNEYVFEDISFNSVDDSDLEHAYVTESYN